MQEFTFSFSNLLPKFGLIFTPEGWQTGEAFSALVVGFLLLVGLIFLGTALYHFRKARNKIRFYKRLISDQTQLELAKQRRSVLNRALDTPEYGKLWKEFDESLVYSSEGNELLNTLDAAHFFNTRTLARRLTENRLLAAVPGFLTAIGVIGTFAGLTMGLSHLQIQETSGVDELRSGMAAMIGGAAIAFMTSVWGVFTSVLFNFLEKLLERDVRRHIYLLQNNIDFLYPRITAEQSLVTISDYTKSSDMVLQGLAEKIGTKMQEAMDAASVSIQKGMENSLNNVLQPAIDTLVSNANQGSEKALKGLLGSFMEGVGEIGGEQREMMEVAARSIQDSTHQLGENLTKFISKLEDQTLESASFADEQQSILEGRLAKLAEESSLRQNELTRQFEGVVSNMANKFNQFNNDADERESKRAERAEEEFGIIFRQSGEAVEQFSGLINANIENQEARDELRHEKFEEQLQGLTNHQENLLHQVEGLNEKQQDLFADVLQQLNLVKSSFSDLIKANSAAGAEVLRAAEKMNGTSNQLGVLSNNLKLSAEQLGQDVRQAASSSTALSKENEKISADMKLVLKGFDELRDRMQSVTENLNAAANHAETGLDTVGAHYQSLQNKLQEHIETVQRQVAKLLKDFAVESNRQVQERFNSWNSQTSQYTSAMQGAIESLNSVVDEIEVKVDSLR